MFKYYYYIVLTMISTQQLPQLQEQLFLDSNLKKNKKAKFAKHAETLHNLHNNLTLPLNQPTQIMLSRMYKNLGKIGEDQQSLLNAVKLLPDRVQYKAVRIRWLLQMAAMKSSRKQHQQCFLIAQKTFNWCVQILQSLQNDQQDHIFISKVLEIAKQDTKDEIIWLYKQKQFPQQMLAKLKRSAPPQLALPHYPNQQLHIADIMSLQSCPVDAQPPMLYPRDIIIYLSISCFTMTTQKYYQKDYSHKNKHIKALKIAICAFDISCSYVSFLTNILHQHFGQRLTSIPQENHNTAQVDQMRRKIPKDPKEVSMKYFQLAQ